MPVAADTTGRIYEDFSRLLFLHAHREASALGNELPEESEQFRFLRAACFANIKGSVGAMCAVVVSKTSCKDRNHRILRGVIAPHQDFFFVCAKIMIFLDF